MPQLWPALSIKQPWAALIVHGLKTIEIRTWTTGKRGTILIHASKIADPDPAAWKLVTSPALMETAALLGGVIGQVELADVVKYTTWPAYTADAAKHRTTPERFRSPVMYGFRLAKPRRVAFLPWPGNTNFFTVDARIKTAEKIVRQKPTKTFIVTLPEDGPR